MATEVTPCHPGHGGVGIPVQLQVIMVVQVNGPGGDDTSGSVYLFICRCLDAPADHSDLSLLDRYIAAIGGYSPRPIHNRAIPNYQIILGHVRFLLTG